MDSLVEVYGLDHPEDKEIQFVVMFSKYRGRWGVGRQKGKTTWEVQGGHRELNEELNEAAARELYEESGARTFRITPVTKYSMTVDGEKSYGLLYYCEIFELGELPEEFEIEEIRWVDSFPENMTYGNLHRLLFKTIQQWNIEGTTWDNFTMREKKKEDIKRFDQLAPHWKNTPESISVASRIIESLGISPHHKILDVASGTGILLSVLVTKEISPKRYVAIDLSSRMLEQLTDEFPQAETYCMDFENKIKFDFCFDYIIIYDSIPHFDNLDRIFANARHNLGPGGKFIIAHSRTRAGLQAHHQRIGFKSPREPIPSRERLIELSFKYDFSNIEESDEEFFYYLGVKTINVSQ